MASDGIQILVKVLADEHEAILGHWSTLLKQAGGDVTSGRIRTAEVQAQARTILDRVRDALGATGMAGEDDARARLDEDLGEISRSRALQGVTSTDTANFIFSLKEPLFASLNRVCAGEPESVASGSMAASRFLDRSRPADHSGVPGQP